MTSAMEAASDELIDVAGAFVTVDPARDTVEQLAAYVPLFHKDLVGLTGDAEAIASLAKAFRAFYRLRTDIDAEDYPVDHSSYIYLMDPAWRLAAVFRHDATPEEITAALRRASQTFEATDGKSRP
jgi:protein SCO1/2